MMGDGEFRQNGTNGEIGNGEGKRKSGRRMKPRISRGEMKNWDQREGRERENRGCGGEWRRGGMETGEEEQRKGRSVEGMNGR